MDRQFTFDYSALRKDIRAQYGTNDAFAKEIRMGRVSLSQKLNNKLDWTQQEMTKSMIALGQPYSAIPAYFFTREVSKTEQMNRQQG